MRAIAVRLTNSSTSTMRQNKRKTHRERVTFYWKHRIKLVIDDKISRVINWCSYLQSPWKRLMLHVWGITKSCITMKIISLWAIRIRWLFSIYLTIFFLCLYWRVVCSLQKVSSFLRCSDSRIPFFFIFLTSASCF